MESAADTFNKFTSLILTKFYNFKFYSFSGHNPNLFDSSSISYGCGTTLAHHHKLVQLHCSEMYQYLGNTSVRKKCFLSGIARMRGGRTLPELKDTLNIFIFDGRKRCTSCLKWGEGRHWQESRSRKISRRNDSIFSRSLEQNWIFISLSILDF